MITVVNMTPASLSGESGQGSEPNLAVNPQDPRQMVGTAFTPAPLGGSFAPIYVSTDGGATWSLRTVVPGNGFAGTSDITVGFGTTGGVLYAGTLNGQSINLQLLRTTSHTSTTPMTVLVDRASEDQPWVVAGSATVAGGSQDRVFVGNNNFNQPDGRTATVDVSQNAAAAPPPAGFSPVQIERRATAGQDGPPIRLALHPDGVVYAVLQRWVTRSGNDLTMDVVVTRDDTWGTGSFAALTDPGDGRAGVPVTRGAFVRWNDVMGQERLGGDLTIAVDPTDSRRVWVAWCDRVGGPSGTDWTAHVRRSTDGGQTWSADVRTLTNTKNPSLAVNDNGTVGLLYQAFTGTRWVTTLEVSPDAWGTVASAVLHTADAGTPARAFFPYLGDYVRLLTLGRDFYGVFSGSNLPDPASFPSGVTYQRRANWDAKVLLANDGVTPVPVSIDPFFFHYAQDVPAPAGGLTADLTGDGRADIVGFGDAGVWASLNNGSGGFPQPTMVVANFAYNAGGWRVEKHPRFLADLTGDGRADIIGFGDAGVWASLNNGSGGFPQPTMVVANFAYNAGGWRVEKHPRFLADLTGDGRADIIGFGDAGVWASLNNGSGGFPQPTMVVANFAYNAGGWRVEKHPRFLADLTGDGRADIVGFGDAGVWVSLNNGNGTFANPTKVVDNFGYNAGGWRVEKHPRFLADLTGDGRADIVGFGDAGVWVSLNNGNGTFANPTKVVDNFGYNAGGWRVEKHPRFLADLTGDGRADIVGFGDAGVWVSLNNGNGTFANPTKVVDNFAYNAGGWRVEKHPRFLADLTGDGRADIIGFGDAGVWESLNNGSGGLPQPTMVVANFAYTAGGWRVERHPRFVAGTGAVGG